MPEFDQRPTDPSDSPYEPRPQGEPEPTAPMPTPRPAPARPTPGPAAPTPPSSGSTTPSAPAPASPTVSGAPTRPTPVTPASSAPTQPTPVTSTSPAPAQPTRAQARPQSPWEAAEERTQVRPRPVGSPSHGTPGATGSTGPSGTATPGAAGPSTPSGYATPGPSAGAAASGTSGSGATGPSAATTPGSSAGTAGAVGYATASPRYAAPQPPAEPPRKGHPFWWGILGGVICSGVLVLLLWAFGVFTPTFLSNPGPTGGQTISIDVGDEDVTVAEAVSAKCSPSVATLVVTTASGAAGGSGVLLDEEGHILTNSHVVEGGEAISCNIGGGSYEATIVGSDPSSDLAVIKADFKGDVHTPIEVGNSEELKVGDWVMAIGSPFGLDLSVSSGIVSSLYHSTILTSQGGNKIYTNLIQTDAAINPGNSGGALVNDEGQLVGINSIIQSYSGSSSGVGFAIPADYAISVAQTIMSGQEVQHAYLGTNIRTVNAQVAAMNALPVSQGAYVVSVTQDGPAAQAGLQEGDIITAIGDTPVTSADGLILAVRSKAVGDKTTVTYWRGNEEHTVDITLGSDASTTGNDTSSGDAYNQNGQDGGNGYNEGVPQDGTNPYGQQELTPEQLQDLFNQLFQ